VTPFIWYKETNVVGKISASILMVEEEATWESGGQIQ
jgi:hypothetical protein